MDLNEELRRVVPMIAGATVMLIVTKPRDARTAIGGLIAGVLVAYFAGDFLIGMAGVSVSSASAANFIIAFAGRSLAIRAADYLQSGKLPVLGGKNESK